ncbi:MAG: signal peptidase I [Acidimicrobiales bacterium]
MELPVLLAIAIAVAFVLKTFVAQAYYIPSPSMQPQLDIGDRVVVSKLAYELHDPRRGDLVVFPSPEKTPATSHTNAFIGFFQDIAEGVGLKEPDEDVLIKRVIGLPGETVEGKGGHVFIDGRQLDEPYLPSTLATEAFPASVIPPDHLWVMGDNRLNSHDSHFFGAIPTSSVIGRAVAKLWPLGATAFL